MPFLDDPDHRPSRRGFLKGAAGLGLAALPLAAGAKPAKEEDEDVTPVEDLMREHGLLNRILLVYEAWMARPAASLEPLGEAAGIVRAFVEDYHERLEEEFLFPRFERAGKLVDLVKVLREQHQAGRRVTQRVLDAVRSKSQDAAALRADLQAFIRLYRPHEAREDTVLFPAFRGLVGRREYEALGERFEAREHKLFGKAGFEGQLARVAELEKALGVADLAAFTPK